ncbi:hypothetical protein AVEN_986-1 [Araneus ventricosus]|uniref:Uncharacterized protein n=1 Tax=Araneus ventricosus TaxID=182803 RepID=A0A4Y2CWG7_ARAVE|nr:hypothetical protein AVEN_986-1 [Araneus ventricosus]
MLHYSEECEKLPRDGFHMIYWKCRNGYDLMMLILTCSIMGEKQNPCGVSHMMVQKFLASPRCVDLDHLAQVHTDETWARSYEPK